MFRKPDTHGSQTLLPGTDCRTEQICLLLCRLMPLPYHQQTGIKTGILGQGWLVESVLELPVVLQVRQLAGGGNELEALKTQYGANTELSCGLRLLGVAPFASSSLAALHRRRWMRMDHGSVGCEESILEGMEEQVAFEGGLLQPLQPILRPCDYSYL